MDTAKGTTTNMQWPYLWVSTNSFSEEAGWLTKKSPLRSEREGLIPQQTASIRFIPSMGVVVSKKGIRFVSVYDVCGRMLFRVHGDGARRVVLPDARISLMSTGQYVLRIVTEDNKVGHIPWVVIQ